MRADKCLFLRPSARAVVGNVSFVAKFVDDADALNVERTAVLHVDGDFVGVDGSFADVADVDCCHVDTVAVLRARDGIGTVVVAVEERVASRAANERVVVHAEAAPDTVDAQCEIKILT